MLSRHGKDLKKKAHASIMNNNEARFDAFTSVIPGILNKINQYFIPMEHLINQWGYEIK